MSGLWLLRHVWPVAAVPQAAKLLQLSEADLALALETGEAA